MKQNLRIFLVFMITTQIANAQQTEGIALPDGSNTVQVNPETNSEKKSFAVTTYLEVSEKIAKDERSAKENSLAIQISPTYKWNELLTSTSEIVINRDNFGQQETTTSDLKIGLSVKGFQISESWKTKHSLGTVAPMNQLTIKRDRLKGNFSISNSLEYKNTYFTTTYTLGLSQNFHEFNQNADGNPNVQKRISQSLAVDVPITEKLSLSGSGLYRIGYTYNNFTRFSFGIDLDVNYDFNPNFSLNIGTSNEGNALKSNGLDSNIAAYDDKNSVTRLGMTYSY